MKKIASILSVLALGWASVSCNDYLDEVASKTLISAANVNSVEELDILMVGAYAGFGREIAFGGNALVMGETFADLVTVNNVNYRNSPSRSSLVYQWRQREVDYGYQAEFMQWSTFGINNANVVIEILRADQVKTPNETDPRRDIRQQRARLEGDARFVRSLCIFEQLRIIAYPWGHTPDNSHPGPISRFSSVSDFGDLTYPRMSVKAAYDSILVDLHMAERMLPDHYDPAIHLPEYEPRANKWAALALMARVYWQQDNVDSCLAVTNRLLGANGTRFPLVPGNRMLEDLWQRTGLMPGVNSAANRDEIIFELVNVRGRNSRTNNGAPLRRSYVLSNGGYSAAQLQNVNNLTSGPDLRLSQRFKQLANFDRSQDLRYRTLIDTTQATTASTAWDSPNRLWFPKKWGSRGTARTPVQGVDNNVVIYRAAEFMLIRAEMNARKGNTAAALADLNRVRTRAGLAALTSAPANLVDEIQTEFIRETFVEGTRIHNLKRQKKSVDPGDRPLSPDGIDCAISNCAPLPWNDKNLVFLIPQNFLDRNPQAVQND